MVDAKTNNSQKKIYVLDTSVLLSSPYAIFAFDEHVVWIPYNVITDLDAMRKTTNEASKNAQEALRIIEELRERGVNFRSLTDAIDTSTPMGRFFFHVMGALAEMERELIVERTRAGLAAARAKGRVGGRRPKLTTEQWAQIGRLLEAGESRQRIALIFDVGVSTIYRKFPANKSNESP